MSQQDKEKEHYDKGKKALNENNYDIAINEFTKAIEIDSTHADTFNNRGVAYEKKGELNKAINDYTSAIELFSKDKDKTVLAKVHYNRGSIHFNKTNYDFAIKDFTKAIELNPDFTDAYLNRGNAYFKNKKYDKAAQDFTKAIEIDSTSKNKITPILVEATKKQGHFYLRNKEYDKAIEEYTRAINFNTNDSDIYFERGVAFANKPDYPNAINNFNKAIELNPENAKAYYNRGRVYDSINDLRKAIDDYSLAIKFDQHYKSAYSNRGLLYSEIGEYGKALDDFNTTIEFKQEDSNDYNSRGHLYRIMGVYGSAIEDCNKAIFLNPNNEQAYNNLGSVYNDLGGINRNENDFDKAILEFTKAIDIKPSYAVAFYNMGIAFANKYVIYVDKINQCKENNLPYTEYEKLAIIDYDKAIYNYTKAIQLKPDYVNAYNARREIYSIKGEHGKAAKDFADANNLPPNRLDSITTGDKFNLLDSFSETIENLSDAPEISSQFLYKYKAIDKEDNTINALYDESIWVPSPSTFNDPLDGSYLYDKFQNLHFNEDLKGIGIISFESVDFERGGINTLMWSHYADSHRGICLIYKRETCEEDKQTNCKSNKIQEVKYENDIPLRLDTTKEMFKTGFCTKHKSWKYENEFRLILHKENLGKGSLFTTKELGLKLVGVIFGLKSSDDDEKIEIKIRKILDKQEIEYYKIENKVKHRVVKHLQLIKTRIEI